MTTASESILLMTAAAAEPQTLIVSLHDVAPATQAVCAAILSDLKEAGVHATSLLVVPDYHQQGRAMENSRFVSWLGSLESHEVVLHGYYHERPHRLQDAWPRRIVTRVYTAGEGEFLDLSYEEAFARIVRGRDEFSAAKFEPVGFIAPAWLLNAAGERAARDAGMHYTVKLTKIIDLHSGHTQHARSLVYSTRAGWRRIISLGWNETLARLSQAAPVLRLSIHPPDRSWPAIWAQTMKIVRRVASRRRVTTYRDWVVEQRSL